MIEANALFAVLGISFLIFATSITMALTMFKVAEKSE